MILNRMIRPAHPQARDRARKETPKDPYILSAGRLVPRLQLTVEDVGGEQEEDCAEEMRVDIYGFVVDVQEGGPGFDVGVGLWAVARGYVGVITLPGGEFVPEVG